MQRSFVAADQISLGDSQWGLWKHIRNTEAGVWRLSGSYPGGREGRKFLREESAWWAQEAEGSLYHMVTEQRRVQKERHVKESTLKCASILWSRRRIQMHCRCSLVCLGLSPLSQTYPSITMSWWDFNGDSEAPAILSQMLPVWSRTFFTALETSTGRKVERILGQIFDFHPGI